ncbi:hypothetical protein APHAL10511_007598 [Amanita phalloides]|nr:hypothetical protein APHAL10511_007598 [Amanita phalloides]
MTTAVQHRCSAEGYAVIRKIIKKVRDQLKCDKPSSSKKQKEVKIEHSDKSLSKKRKEAKIEEHSDTPSPAKKWKGKKHKEELSVKVYYVLVRPAEDQEPHPSWAFPEGWNDRVNRIDHRGEGFKVFPA